MNVLNLIQPEQDYIFISCDGIYTIINNDEVIKNKLTRQNSISNLNDYQWENFEIFILTFYIKTNLINFAYKIRLLLEHFLVFKNMILAYYRIFNYLP